MIEDDNNLTVREIFLYPIGELIDNRYLVKSKIGEGGIGAIFLAEDTRLYSQNVVIKLLQHKSNQSQYLVDKFKHESEAMARIKHPGVVSVLDLGHLPDGSPYIVMEYVEGKTLASEIQVGGMDFHRAATFIRQMAQALFSAHFEGVVHRDLKPENVMIQRLSDGTEQIKLIDFGIAKITNPQSADATQVPTLIGSPAYMSPEQIEKGEVSAASDIYALGAIAYQLVTGYFPFVVDTTSNLWMIELLNLQKTSKLRKPKELREQLSDAAQDEILKALSYDSKDRHQHVFEFGEGLNRALSDENLLTPVKFDLAATLDISGLPKTMLFNTSRIKSSSVNKTIEKFECLWSKAILTDNIYPLPPEKVKEEIAQRVRGLGKKPGNTQYAYKLGSRLCIAFDLDFRLHVRGLGAQPSNKSGFLTLLDEGPEGVVYCLCPSIFAPATQLKEGKFYLPQNNSIYESFELSGTAGKEKLLAIISDEPLSFNWLSTHPEMPARLLSDKDLEDLFVELQLLEEDRWTALATYFEVIK